MIRALSILVVRTAELFEAEGRSLRGEALRMVRLTVYYVATCTLTIIGLLVVAAGLFLALSDLLTPAGALVLIGGLILAAGLVMIALAWRNEPDNARKKRDDSS